MRFERLELEKYGHFTRKSLELSGDEVRLHIVHGRNEAGKSTILSAIADLLFGIPERTTFNFLHNYKSLTIGATILSQTGAKLSFKRRKLREKTLYSHEGVPLPDGALVPFLGDADRRTFEDKFGLDHERLRAAGNRMMESDGDLGRSLFEAGSGLDGVDRALASLQAEFETLGTPARNSPQKPLWRAAKLFDESQKEKHQLALRHTEFKGAEKRLADAVAAKAKINEELSSIRERRSGLERIRRAGPILIDLDRLARELAAFADVPNLPASFETDRLSHAQRLLAAETALATAHTAREALTRELDAIPTSDTFTRFAAEIAALQTRLGEYLKGVADEPKLARDIARFDDEIGRLIASLGLALGPDEVGDRIPKKPLVARLRAAIRDGDKLRAKLEKAMEESVRAERALGEAEEDLARFDAVGDPAPAIAFLEAAAKHGDVATVLAKGRTEASNAARAAEEACRRVAGWTDGLDALATTAFPSLEAVHEHEQQLQKLVAAKDTAVLKRDEAEAEILDIAAEITSLEAAGDIPSAQAVAFARDRRDRLWQRVRDRPRDASEPESDLLGDYERSVRQADELADRKSAEAQRVARFVELAGRKERLSKQVDSASTRLGQIGQDLERLHVAWDTGWAAIGVSADTPAAMRAFLAARDDALRRLADKRQAEAELALATETEARARALLVSAGQALGLAFAADLSFDGLDQQVRAAVKAQESEWKKRQATEAAALRARRLLREKSKDVTALEDAMRAWTEDWSSLVRDVSCPDDAGPDEASVVVEIWDQMREPLTKRVDTSRRLEGLRADTARFCDDLGHLVGAIERLARERGDSLGFDADADPRTSLQTLGRRLEEEKLRLAKREDVGKRHEAATLAAEKADAALAAAQMAIADLRRLHALDETADLADLGRRAAEKCSIAESLKKRREDLAKAGEGFDEAALREQCRSCSPDAAEAEVAALRECESALVERGQAAAQGETSARQALDMLRARTGAAEADAKGRNAALAFAGHAERWLLLETAHRLLIRAIERYRLENQDPMITRASELLARIAAGAENPIIRLGVEYRDGKAPEIIAWRSDGRACEVKHLSEGTRDQLFLCLRIAAIELYAKEREPLPFIADDLFVTSDDDRIVPGLAALAELGRTTQVLLFTHHRHVVEAARTLPAGAVEVHELSELRDLASAQPDPA